MKITKLEIEGSWLLESPIHSDNRGTFSEWYKSEIFLEATNQHFSPAQANISTSTKGTLRGIHFSLSEIGQAKLVLCASGEIQDVIVDLRLGSPTFGHHQSVHLEQNSGKSLYIAKGLGHGFLSLVDNSAVVYLVSSKYSPSEEFGVSPFDSDLNIKWWLESSSFKVSDKDSKAESLQVLIEANRLPRI
jgi:dTDP-4-dehydrorhamnose 3,5-epimerase